MNSREQLKQIIFELLKDIAPEEDPSRLNDNDHLGDTLGIDSFDHLTLLTGLEEQLEVDIPEEDAGDLVTLGQMLDYLEKKEKAAKKAK